MRGHAPSIAAWSYQLSAVSYQLNQEDARHRVIALSNFSGEALQTY